MRRHVIYTEHRAGGRVVGEDWLTQPTFEQGQVVHQGAMAGRVAEVHWHNGTFIVQVVLEREQEEA